MAQSGTVSVAGAELWCEVVGEGEPVVLLHAGIGDSRLWDGQVAALAGSGRGFQVIRYDARGFGRSGAARGAFSPRADLAALLAALGVGPAHLVGLSMGGAVALDAALEFPGLARSLVLAATRPSGLAPSAALVRGWEAVDAALEVGEVERANEMELAMWVDGPRRSPAAVEPTVRGLVRRLNGELLARPDEGAPIPLDPPAVGRLGEVRVPTLVLAGAEDQPDVLAAADRLAKGIAGARGVTIAGTAHLSNLERPEEFDRLVAAFLTEPTPTRDHSPAPDA